MVPFFVVSKKLNFFWTKIKNPPYYVNKEVFNEQKANLW